MATDIRNLSLVDAGLLTEEDLKDISNPQWEAAGRTNDWRSYIPIELKIRWDSLSDDTKRGAFFVACAMALAE